MIEDAVQVTWDGAMCKIRLDRIGKANSLTASMLRALIEAFASADRAARVIVLTGAGRVFSAGADLDEARAGLATSPLWEELSGAVASSSCLTVAALNGTVAGGALGMVLACDVRISVPEAKFFYPVMKLGFLPQPSDPSRMRSLIGPARTKMILMAGQKIDAEDALSWGLVDRLVPADKLPESIDELVKDTLTAAAGHVSAIKNLIEAQAGQDR
jgi:enoyl-CoA hydratase/carnithine racemase